MTPIIFFDEYLEESLDVAEFLDDHSILYTKMPCRALVNAELVVGLYHFVGWTEILCGLKYLKIIDGVRTPPTGDRDVRI